MPPRRAIQQRVVVLDRRHGTLTYDKSEANTNVHDGAYDPHDGSHSYVLDLRTVQDVALEPEQGARLLLAWRPVRSSACPKRSYSVMWCAV